MDEYEGADEGFRGLARRDAARREAAARDRAGRDQPGRDQPGHDRAGRARDGRDGDQGAERSGLADPDFSGWVDADAGSEGSRPVHRFPIPGYGDLTESMPEVHPVPGGVGLPHWADPPTGEVPLIVPTNRPGGGAGSGSARRAQPDDSGRTMAWRNRDTDWDDLDFEPLGTGGGALGALDEQREDPGDIFSFDSMDEHASGWAQARPVKPKQGSKGGRGTSGSPDPGAFDRPDLTSQLAFEPTPEAMAGVAGEGLAPQGRGSRRVALPGRGRSTRPADLGGTDYDIAGAEARGGLAVSTPDLGPVGPSAGFEGSGSMPGEPLPGEPVRSGSSGLIRTVTGVGIGVLLLLALKVGPSAALALVVLLVTMAAAELYGVLRRAGYKPATLLGLVATVCLMVAVYLKGEAAIGVVVAITMAASLLWYLLGVERDQPTANLAATVLGFLWVGLLGSYAALLISPALFPDRHGEAFFLGAVIATVAYDVGALVVGSRQGRHPLAPSASPNKTWEGMVGGIVVCLVISALVVGRIHPWDTASAFGLGVVVCVVAPLGDLCESVVKRDLRIKDMGSILPGHGGVLDRLDALLFVVPATFYFVRVLGIGVG